MPIKSIAAPAREIRLESFGRNKPSSVQDDVDDGIHVTDGHLAIMVDIGGGSCCISENHIYNRIHVAHRHLTVKVDIALKNLGHDGIGVEINTGGHLGRGLA